jgi:hypothetical protein
MVLALAQKSLKEIKLLLMELTYCEIHLKGTNELHKASTDHSSSNSTVDKWNYVTKKYMLTLYTYLTLN